MQDSSGNQCTVALNVNVTKDDAGIGELVPCHQEENQVEERISDSVAAAQAPRPGLRVLEANRPRRKRKLHWIGPQLQVSQAAEEGPATDLAI